MTAPRRNVALHAVRLPRLTGLGALLCVLLVAFGCGEEPAEGGPTLAGPSGGGGGQLADGQGAQDGAGPGQDAGPVAEDVNGSADAAGVTSDAHDDAGPGADTAQGRATADALGDAGSPSDGAGASDASTGDSAGGDSAASDSAADGGSDGAVDVGALDGGGLDGAVADSATGDAGAGDAGSADGGAPDAAGPDAVNPDAVNPDAVNPDAVNPDAVNPDATSTDAVTTDTAKADIGAADAVAADTTTAPDSGASSDAAATDTAPVDAGCAGPELCDGLDNNCDGKTDEGSLCDDDKPCTVDTCAGAKGCSHAPVAVAKPCDGVMSGGRCYKALKFGPKTWGQAEAECKGWGGHLTSIASATENATVVSQAKGVCGAGFTAWIGLNDTQKEGSYVWVDGTPTGFTAWSPGEPNNWFGEDVVAMLASGKWNDVDAKDKLSCAVCERAAPKACDDGDACTTGDVCYATGACVGASLSCDDGNACTSDVCDSKVGCSHGKLADGSKCGAGGGLCQSGTCVVGTSGAPATSCKALLATAPKTASGAYWLDPDGAGPVAKFKAWCDMSASGGGWTLALKLDGKKTTFSYGAKWWTDSKTFNTGSTDLSQSEAKFASYATVPFTQLRVGMRVGASTHWLVVPLAGSSLRARIAPGKHVATKVGRDAWKGLITGSSLQKHCNQEGLNVGTQHARARIGIVGNNEKNCKTPDSRLGFGGAGDSCFADPKNSCGNAATCGADKGSRNTKAFGWIMVR